MGQIMIRSLDATVIEALRRRAAACGTSMEEQARRALTKAVGLEREAAARRLAEIRHTIGRLEGPTAYAIISAVALESASSPRLMRGIRIELRHEGRRPDCNQIYADWTILCERELGRAARRLRHDARDDAHHGPVPGAG